MYMPFDPSIPFLLMSAAENKSKEYDICAMLFITVLFQSEKTNTQIKLGLR